MRFWDDKDGNGNKLTDGRICLVIQSDDNPDMPEIRTYGKDKEEILDKIAKTAETAQGQIHRMRKSPSPPPPPPAAARAAAPDALKIAASDLSKPENIKTLLKSVGVDVDQQQAVTAIRAVANLAEKWESENPEYPKDPRNDRILMKMVINNAGGDPRRVTEAHFEAAFEEGRKFEMFFEPKPAEGGSTVQPGGTPDSRTARNATSYRRNALRSPEPAPPSRESAKEERWRNILENGTGKALEDAIRNEAGFAEWVDKATRKKTA